MQLAWTLARQALQCLLQEYASLVPATARPVKTPAVIAPAALQATFWTKINAITSVLQGNIMTESVALIAKQAARLVIILPLAALAVTMAHFCMKDGACRPALMATIWILPQTYVWSV